MYKLKYLYIVVCHLKHGYQYGCQGVQIELLVYVTGFAKTGLIAGVRNCSYSPFSSAKVNFCRFLFSSKIKNMTLMLYVHTIIIPGSSIKAKNKSLTYLGPGNLLP